MALQGTLKDFGIAEILQLIAQQAKSGVLHLRSRDQEIHIAIAEGSVVRAEYAGRRAREKLGSMLVRAGILTEDDLGRALEEQTRSLRRLGDILVGLGLLSTEDLRQMTALQTTETIYQLFHWKTGTYEFEPGAPDYDPATCTPLRAETLLMEGFRQVDEWPMVRRRISSPLMTFERLRPLEGEVREAGRTVTVSLGPGSDEATFSGLRERSSEQSGLGSTERKVYGLADPGVPVERIVDRSRLGEFETCKALLTLANLGYLRPVEAPRHSTASQLARDWRSRGRRWASVLAATVVLAAVLAGLAQAISRRGLAAPGLRDNTGQRILARYQLGRLRGALEVYRLERGEYPEQLGDLLGVGLADERDLAYPWRAPYHYRRTAGGYLLLPPIE